MFKLKAKITNKTLRLAESCARCIVTSRRHDKLCHTEGQSMVMCWLPMQGTRHQAAGPPDPVRAGTVVLIPTVIASDASPQRCFPQFPERLECSRTFNSKFQVNDICLSSGTLSSPPSQFCFFSYLLAVSTLQNEVFGAEMWRICTIVYVYWWPLHHGDVSLYRARNLRAIRSEMVAQM